MNKLPKRFTSFMETYPEIGAAYGDMSKAVASSGPLDEKTCILVKLGISIGAGMEGATHSQARKALEVGASHDELRHAALQALTTIGFPSMMRGLSWVEEVIAKADSL